MGKSHWCLASILNVCHFQTLSEVVILSQAFQRKFTKAERKYKQSNYFVFPLVILPRTELGCLLILYGDHVYINKLNWSLRH